MRWTSLNNKVALTVNGEKSQEHVIVSICFFGIPVYEAKRTSLELPLLYFWYLSECWCQEFCCVKSFAAVAIDVTALGDVAVGDVALGDVAVGDVA